MKQKERRFDRFLIPVLTAGLFILSVWHLTTNLKTDLRDTAYDTLYETAVEQGLHAKEYVLARFALLETAASLVPADAFSGTPEEIATYFASIPTTGAFVHVFFAAVDGTACAASHETLSLSEEPIFLAAMRGERAAGRLSTDASQFLFAVPVYQGQMCTGAVIGFVPAARMDALLSTQLFSGSSCFYVSDKEGALLFSGDPDVRPGQDVLTPYDIGAIDAATDRTIRQHMLAGESGTIETSKNGAPIYGVYARLGVFGWYVFHTVPAATVNGDNAFIRSNILTFGTELVLIAGFLTALVVLSEKQRSRRIRSDRERLQQSEESYRLLNELSEGVMFEGSHRDGTLHFNKSYYDVFGREPFITCVADLQKENPYVYARDLPAYRAMANDLIAKTHTSSAEFRLYDKMNEPRWYRAEYLTALDSAHRPGRFVGKLTDVDNEKRTLLRLSADAERDPLTKLLNRASMEQRVDDYLQTDGKAGLHAFMMLDLDDFKQVNDTYGHMTGDQMLCEVGDRLRALFRTSDFICRMGGDEFCIFLCNINSAQRIRIKAQAVVDTITQLGRRYDTHPRVSVSVGVAIPGKDGDTYAALYKNADAALYRAKQSGKGTYLFFSD